MLKTPETTEKSNNYTDLGIRFIHNTRLGCTIGYCIKDDCLFLSAAFCAKQGYGFPRPNASKPDQFSRKVGRAIAAARVVALIQKGLFASNIPYVTFLKGISNTRDSLVMIEADIHNALNFLESVHNGYTYNKVDRLSQIENDSVLNTIYSLLVTSTKLNKK